MSAPKLPCDLQPGDRVLLVDEVPRFTVGGRPPPARDRELTVASKRRDYVAMAWLVVFTDGTAVHMDPRIPVAMAGGGR